MNEEKVVVFFPVNNAFGIVTIIGSVCCIFFQLSEFNEIKI